MITIPVHPLTRKAIIYQFGSDHIPVERVRALRPLLTLTSVRSTIKLSCTITITGDTKFIRADAGYGLYLFHMEQLLDFIRLGVANDRNAYTSMMEYYTIIGLDIDELPPETAYKRWQRSKREKFHRKYLLKPYRGVLRNIGAKNADLNDCLAYTSAFIQTHPRLFLKKDGLPSEAMIRKIIMHTLWKRHNWPQQVIAQTFGIRQPTAHEHIRTMDGILSTLKS